MAETSKLFDQRIHDAYETVELSAEAQDRMLASLLTAQDARRDALPDAGALQELPAEQPHEAEVIALPRRSRKAAILLPMAAVLLVALVIARVTLLGNSNTAETATFSSSAHTSEKAAESAGAAANEVVYEDAAEGMVYEDAAEEMESLVASPMADEASQGQPLAELYATVTLVDGTSLTTLVDGSAPTEADASQIGERLGEATATSAAGDQISCEVFSLVDGSRSYAVRYMGDSRFWLCG